MTIVVYTAPATEPPNVSGIYMIRCKPTCKVYVGSAIWIAKRWRHHREALRKGRHHSRHLQSAWDKYGEDAFEFCVLSVLQKENLITEEQRFMDQMNASNPAHGFNMNPRAGSNLGRKFGPEFGKKISTAKRGQVVSTEHRAAISQSLIGNKRALGSRHSDETKAKYCAMRTGKNTGPRVPLSQEHKKKLSAFNLGKVLSTQHRAKISEAHKGKKQSTEHRAKLADAQKKLSSHSVAIVRARLADGISYRRIAAEVACSAQTICNIKLGRIEVYQ